MYDPVHTVYIINPSVGASERYFRSLYEDHRRALKGIKEKHRVVQRRLRRKKQVYFLMCIYSSANNCVVTILSRNFAIDAKHLTSIHLQSGRHRERIELGRYWKKA